MIVIIDYWMGTLGHKTKLRALLSFINYLSSRLRTVAIRKYCMRFPLFQNYYLLIHCKLSLVDDHNFRISENNRVTFSRIRRRYIRQILRGCFDLIKQVPSLVKERKPIRNVTAKHYLRPE
jgi:hypothetical protein